jgi:hypothetical protein
MDLPITSSQPLLPSKEGRQMTELQKKIVDIALQDKTLDAQQIADRADCHVTNIYKVLSKQHVREYLLTQVNSELMLSAPEAMAVQRTLLQSKSDYIRNKAASDLLDRSGIGERNAIIGQTVNVKIDLS